MNARSTDATRDGGAGTALDGSVGRLALALGRGLYEERRRRRMTIEALATKAAVAVGTVHGVENGKRASLEMYLRLARALGRELEINLVQPGKRDRPRDDTDIVHAAMGESEVSDLRAHGLGIAVDEPWQHFHFAGRADVLSWDLPRGALLHIENRTRLPDVQDAIGRFNTKRRYLGQTLGPTLGFGAAPRFQTHVMVALWSAEILRVLRRRPATFRAVFPDPPDALYGWLAGQPPQTRSVSTFALLDPFATGRQRRFLGLEAAIESARPRVHGYAEAADLLRKRP
jgi:transcriptional regulator with XRE-family HTH domain